MRNRDTNFKTTIFLLIVSSLFSLGLFVRGGEHYGKNVDITGDTEQLKYFFKALKNTGSSKIRIAHYGDSIIWGDVISDHLRNYFQNKYGGHGLGFISICTDDIAARKTVIHEFSDDWDWGSVFTKNRNRYPIGIAGTVGAAADNSWVTFQTMNLSPTTDSFSEFSIFYSNASSNSKMLYWLDGGKKKESSLKNGSELNVTRANIGKRTKKIKLQFQNSKGAYFYGISLESGNGIYLDNFPFRGNAGVGLREISKELLPGFAANLNYKLIILQFGVNVVSAGNVNHKWYERMMLKTIKKLKKYFPETSIIMISPGDLGQKRGTRIVTHPGIKKFVRSQQKIAEKAGVAFWNMFEAMGGENSIADWVEATPQLAYKDYCHLTWDGGDLIANEFITALMKLKK